MSRALMLMGTLLVAVLIPAHAGHACACCTNEGQRYVATEKLDADKREGMSRLRFHADAQLFVGEGDPDTVKGIAKTSGRFALHVAQESGRWIFNFRDKGGASGTLTFAMPATVSMFHIDPRLGEPKGGQGPALYKEWKLTSNAVGTGIFAPGMGSGQRLTLVLQGHGNNCTSVDMFTHWTLVLFGPKAEYHLFGEFVQ